MKKLVTTALALAAVGSASDAGTGDNDWLALDGEIKDLASSLTPSRDGMGWAVLLRTAFTYSKDDILTFGGDDIDGFTFRDVDFAVWGSVGDYGWRINTDVQNNFGAGADIELEDAYAWWHCGEYFTAQMGSQKPRFVRTGYIDPEKTLFIDRSALGSVFDWWDLGLQANGNYDAFAWFVGLFNGFDDDTSDHAYFARGEWSLGAGSGMAEGATSGNDDLNATIGLAYYTDDTADSGNSDLNAWALDVAGSVGPLGFGAEYVSLGDDAFLGTGPNNSDYLGGGFFVFDGDSSPWDIWASWLLAPEWEVGIRYESLDNDQSVSATNADNTLLSLVAAYYQSGHNAKWQAQWTNVDADNNNPDGSIFQVGLSLGMTR
jgi:phosphate-selective porin